MNDSIESSDIESFNELLHAAEQGDASAQYEVGDAYYLGNLVSANHSQAAIWYRRAAEQGHLLAQYDLAKMYARGDSVPQDYSETVKLLRQVIDHHRDSAEIDRLDNAAVERLCDKENEDLNKELAEIRDQYDAECSDDEDECPDDDEDECQDNEDECSDDEDECQDDEDECQDNDEDECSDDDDESYSLMDEELEYDYVHMAISDLADCYLYGWGVEQDDQQAIKWRVLSCQYEEWVPREFVLGSAFAQGEGVPQDWAQAFKWFKAGADLGILQTYDCVARCYLYGLGVPQDKAEALKWYKKLIKSWRKRGSCADANAQLCALAQLFADGEGFSQDWKQAFQLYQEAAMDGDHEAQTKLAECYYYGHGTDPNPQQSIYWHRTANADSDTNDMCSLADRLMTGDGIPQDLAEAQELYHQVFEICNKLSVQGYRPALEQLGTMYFYGKGVPKSEPLAQTFYEKAAQMADSMGLFLLGERYAYGNDITQDYGKAAKLFLQAAEQGHNAAQFALGQLYLKGCGVEKDLGKAIDWYRLAAQYRPEDNYGTNKLNEKAQGKAQFELGECYFYGIGVNEDKAEALEWYAKAAGHDHALAKLRLGECYYLGLATTVNYNCAFRCYLEVANPKHSTIQPFATPDQREETIQAQFRLGECYELGRGVRAIRREAIRWYTAAAAAGHAEAKAALQRLSADQSIPS